MGFWPSMSILEPGVLSQQERTGVIIFQIYLDAVPCYRSTDNPFSHGQVILFTCIFFHLVDLLL